MDNERQIGKIAIDENTWIIVRTGQFMNREALDIREYTEFDDFMGFTKRGIRVFMEHAEVFTQTVARISRDTTRLPNCLPSDRHEGKQKDPLSEFELPYTIGSIKRDEQVDIVFRIVESPAGDRFVDIREYLKADSFEGFTKRGIHIRENIWPKVFDALEPIFGLSAVIIKSLGEDGHV